MSRDRSLSLNINITMLHNITCVTFFRVITFRRDNRSDPAKAKL